MKVGVVTAERWLKKTTKQNSKSTLINKRISKRITNKKKANLFYNLLSTNCHTKEFNLLP